MTPFRPWLPHPLAQAGAMGALALALGLLGNLAARPERRVPWKGYGPAPALPAAPESASLPAPIPGPIAAASVPVRPRPTPAAAGRPAPDPEALKARFPLDPSNPIRELDEAEAWEAWRRGALFVDARRSAEYRAGHIAGAQSAPLWEEGLEARLADLRDFHAEDPLRVIVLYCGGGSCTDSHDLARRLFALGLPNLRIFTGGYPAWARQGRPVARGAQP